MYAQGKPLEGTGYLGYDAAGVVDEVGEGVTGVAVGDDVFGLGSNTQAEYAVLDAWAHKPASVDWAVAAAAGVVAETAERVAAAAGRDRRHHALHRRRRWRGRLGCDSDREGRGVPW